MSRSHRDQIYRELRQKQKEIREIRKTEGFLLYSISKAGTQAEADFDKLYAKVGFHEDRRRSAGNRKNCAAHKRIYLRAAKRSERQESLKNELRHCEDDVI